MNTIIKSKADYLYFCDCDRLALRMKKSKPRLFTDEIWRFQLLLRKREYYENVLCKSSNIFIRITSIVISKYLHYKYKKLEILYGYSIPLNVFGPGLSIAHLGTIVVADKAKIGSNCRIHEGVTIGATNGSSESAIIGNNVFIGTGAKIIGAIKISDNVAIAANAVVVKDIICEKGCTVGGVPAKIISYNDSSSNIIKSTEIINKKLKQKFD